MTAAPTCGAACGKALNRRFLALLAGIHHRQRGHVDQPANRCRRGEDVHRAGAAQQDRAHRHAVAVGDLEQVEGDVGGVQVGHHQQVGFAVQGGQGMRLQQLPFANGNADRFCQRNSVNIGITTDATPGDSTYWPGFRIMPGVSLFLCSGSLWLNGEKIYDGYSLTLRKVATAKFKKGENLLLVRATGVSGDYWRKDGGWKWSRVTPVTDDLFCGAAWSQLHHDFPFDSAPRQ